MANKVFAFTGVGADMKSAFCDAIENLKHLKEAVGTAWNKLHWDGCHVSGGMTDIPAVKSCKLLDMSYDFSSLFEFNGLMSVRAHQATEYCLEHSEIAPSKPNNLYALDLGRVYSQEDLIPSVFDYKILGDLYRVYAKDAHGSVVSDNLFTDRLKAM